METDHQKMMKLAFNDYDSDKSGKLDKAEFRNFLNEVKASQNLPEIDQDQFVKILQLADKNDDGEIKYSEFLNNMNDILLIQSEPSDNMCKAIKKAFHDFDVDGSGYLEKNELKLQMNLAADKQQVQRCKQWQIEYIFNVLDCDLDERVDTEEFMGSYSVINRELLKNKSMAPRKLRGNDFFVSGLTFQSDKKTKPQDSSIKTDHIENINKMSKKSGVTLKEEALKKQALKVEKALKREGKVVDGFVDLDIMCVTNKGQSKTFLPQSVLVKDKDGEDDVSDEPEIDINEKMKKVTNLFDGVLSNNGYTASRLDNQPDIDNEMVHDKMLQTTDSLNDFAVCKRCQMKKKQVGKNKDIFEFIKEENDHRKKRQTSLESQKPQLNRKFFSTHETEPIEIEDKSYFDDKPANQQKFKVTPTQMLKSQNDVSKVQKKVKITTIKDRVRILPETHRDKISSTLNKSQINNSSSPLKNRILGHIDRPKEDHILKDEDHTSIDENVFKKSSPVGFNKISNRKSDSVMEINSTSNNVSQKYTKCFTLQKLQNDNINVEGNKENDIMAQTVNQQMQILNLNKNIDDKYEDKTSQFCNQANFSQTFKNYLSSGQMNNNSMESLFSKNSHEAILNLKNYGNNIKDCQNQIQDNINNFITSLNKFMGKGVQAKAGRHERVISVIFLIFLKKQFDFLKHPNEEYNPQTSPRKVLLKSSSTAILKNNDTKTANRVRVGSGTTRSNFWTMIEGKNSQLKEKGSTAIESDRRGAFNSKRTTSLVAINKSRTMENNGVDRSELIKSHMGQLLNQKQINIQDNRDTTAGQYCPIKDNTLNLTQRQITADKGNSYLAANITNSESPKKLNRLKMSSELNIVNSFVNTSKRINCLDLRKPT